MRLEKYISFALDISRSDAKHILKSKRIKVNDIILTDASYQVNDSDIVTYNDEKIVYEEFIYLLLNKPTGYVTSTDDPNYPTVMSLIDEYKKYDLFPVGRLDVDSTGLLLITNDGQLSHELLSPSKHVDKTYLVESLNELRDEDIILLSKGIMLDGKMTNPITVTKVDKKIYQVVIKEGKYHEVKRAFERVNNKVLSLKRIKMGNIVLPEDLEIGHYIKLNNEQINLLKGVSNEEN